MKRILQLAALLLLTCFGVNAQGNGSYHDVAWRFLQGFPNFPAPGATVTICNFPATSGQIPCTNLATIYGGPTNSPVMSNPITADQSGNFSFWATPGNYVVTITGANVIPYALTITVSGSSGNSSFFPLTVPSSATPSFNSNLNTAFTFTLNQNVTGSTFITNPGSGTTPIFQFNICENGTGGFTMTWPANVTLPTNYIFNTAPNACSPVAFIYNPTTAQWSPWQNFTPPPGLPFTTTPFSATPSFNGSFNSAYGITLTGNVTSSSVTGVPINGNVMKLHICQGAGGPWTFAFPGSFLNTTTIQTTGCTDETFSFDGVANWSQLTQPASGGGGGGGACSSSGNQGTLQAAATAGACQSTGLSESGGVLTNTDQNSNRGPNPRVDATVSPFFARVMNPNTIPVTTGTITGGTNSLAVASAANFLQNDGIVLVGGGGTNCATAPSAPTAFAGLASSSTGTGWMVAGGTGSTSISYSLVAISKGMCYTAASPVVTVSNSNNSMGANTLAITSQAIAAGSNVITVTVGSTTGLATGFWGLIDGTTDNQEFGGYHHFTVVDGTHLSYVGNIDNRYFMSSLSASGGTLYYKAGNHLTLPALPAGTNMQFYAVYRCIGASCALPANAGNYSLVYMSYPANLGFTDATYNQWDDFGTTMTPALTANFGYPWFLPSTPPSTNVNDALVTQITGISGNTFTLHDNAINSTSSSPVRFGNDYAITTANAAVPKTVTGGGGTVYLPPPVENPATNNFCYVTSSYLTISAGAFNQGGAFCAGATITLNSNWSGTNEDGARLVRPNFANQSEINIECLGANPCILRAGTSIRNVTIQSFGPGTMLVFDTSQNQTVTENVNFSTDGGSTDYMGILYYFYGNTGNAFGGSFNNTSWSVGPVQTVGATDTPLFISKNGGEWTLNYMSGNRRGFYFECSPPVLSCEFTEVMKMGEEWQGPIAPLITLNNAGSAGNLQGLIYLEHFFQDSGEAPMFVNASTVGAVGSPIFINQSNAPGNNMPIISGDIFNGGIAISTSVPINNNQIGINHDLTQCMGQENQGNSQGYTGCRLPALNLATTSYAVSHTLTGSEGIANFTVSGLTITLPHALANQTWIINNPSPGTQTLTIDSGTLFGNGATGNITIPTKQGVIASCDGTNCYAAGIGAFGSCSPGGTINAILYNGGGGACAGLNAPIVAGDYIVHYPTPTNAAVPPARDLPGVPINPQSGTTYTEGSANYQCDRGFLVTAGNAGAQTYTMVNPTTACFGQNYFSLLDVLAAGAVTENASGFTVNGGTSFTTPASWLRWLWSNGVNYTAEAVPTARAFPACPDTGGNHLNRDASGNIVCGTSASGNGLSGMTAGQVPIAASATSVTSSEALAGAGAAITTGPASATNNDLTCFTGTAGQIADCGILKTNVMRTDAANTVGAFLTDWSAATWKIPASAGFTAGASTQIGLDTTNKNIHFYANNADSIGCFFASAPVTGHLVAETVTSGTVLCTDSLVSTATAAIAIPNTVLANRRNCSQDTGADDSLKLQNCLINLAAANSQAGIADATGLTGLTWSVDPFDASSLPASGEVWLPPGDTVVSVPVKMPDAWVIRGIGGRSVTGQYGSNLKASASWAATYSTGTITTPLGTPGANMVITTTGSTFNSTNTPVGCAFVGGTLPNITYGIIKSIGSTTSLTLKWGTNNGTGAANTNTFVVFCEVVPMGIGGASNAGAQFGIRLENMGVDCNNIAGCVPVLNWYAQQQSGVTHVSLRGFTNIGLLVEGQPQNSGDYYDINISPGSSCTAGTIPLVIRGASQSMGKFRRITVSKGACATNPTVGVDLQGSFTELDTIDAEQVTTGVLAGANTSCPVACANPPALPTQFRIENAYNPSGSGTTVVSVSNFKGTPTDYTVSNIQGNVTNTFVDSQNACTETQTKLGSYIVDHAGAINESTSTTAGCITTYVTAASAASAAKQTCVSSGTSRTCTYIDFPDVKVIPAANCNNATGGNGWSIGSGGTVTCRAGTNNLGGYISITDTSSTFATFQVAIPEDWDSGTNPYIRFQLASTDATNSHTIIPSIQVACYKGDGSTTDDVAANAAHSLSTTTLNGNANRFWSTSNVQMNSTDMTGCVAGALMQVTVGRATDTATNAEFYSATITFPRLLTVQAN